MAWTDNAIMFWEDADGNLNKVTDHNRQPLSESIERIENKSRMANGTLRRYTVAKKRTWSTSWNLIPSTNDRANGIQTVDGGMAGEDIEAFHDSTDGDFRMVLRRGSADGKAVPTVTDAQLPYSDDNFYIARVMVSDYTKSVERRGIVDLWNLDITLEEV